MGFFSKFFDEAAESAKRQIHEEEQKKFETMEDSVKYMRIEELGEYFTNNMRTGTSIAYKSKLVQTTVARLQNYSMTDKKNFIQNYKSYYASVVNVNFVNLVKKSMN